MTTKEKKMKDLKIYLVLFQICKRSDSDLRFNQIIKNHFRSKK